MRQLTEDECKLLNEAHDVINELLDCRDDEDYQWIARKANHWCVQYARVEEKNGEFEVR